MKTYVATYMEIPEIAMNLHYFFKSGICQLRLAHIWFLKIVSVWVSVSMHVCLCVYPHPRLLISSDMMWRDMDPT